MKLSEYIINNDLVSGNTKYHPHPYIHYYYDNEFTHLKNKEIKLLEIGVRAGISMHMWNNWFTNGTIYGLDITPYNNPSINFNQIDAYTESALSLYENNTFDYIIDDGPHTPETQKFTIQKWIDKLKSKGKIIIEDIGCVDSNNNTKSPEESLNFLIDSINIDISTYKVFDLRDKGQYDSIILEITKK